MRRSYRLFQVNAFTREPFAGNPAGVVLNATGLSAEDMLRIARELKNSETAFIFPARGPDHDVTVRFFTPMVEVPICGHATLAAHYARAIDLGLPSSMVRQKTGAGILPVELIREGQDYRILVTQGPVVFGPALATAEQKAVCRALGITMSDLDPRCPVEIVSTGHSKVLIGVRNKRILERLAPRWHSLIALSVALGSNGYFAFCLESDSPETLTTGRMFAPAIGILEDPVTGNANGPLGAYLVKHRLIPVLGPAISFVASQGRAMGRPGRVRVMVALSRDGQPVHVRVGDEAVLTFEGAIRV